MTILQIRKLALVLRLIDEGNRYEVATQSHPDTWFPPASALQWYIDANWLIRVSGIIYDPRAPQPVNDTLAQGICDICGSNGKLTEVKQHGIAGLMVCEKCDRPNDALAQGKEGR